MLDLFRNLSRIALRTRFRRTRFRIRMLWNRVMGRPQSLDSQRSRLLGPIRVDLDAIAMSGCAQKQVIERHSIANTGIERRQVVFGKRAQSLSRQAPARPANCPGTGV